MKRTAPKSNNVYLKLLIKLYRFMESRMERPFNRVVLKKLLMSKVNQPSVSLSRLITVMKGKGLGMALIGQDCNFGGDGDG